jgi:hypothetical protein
MLVELFAFFSLGLYEVQPIRMLEFILRFERVLREVGGLGEIFRKERRAEQLRRGSLAVSLFIQNNSLIACSSCDFIYTH